MSYKSRFFRYHYEIGFPTYIGDMCLEFFNNFAEVNTTYHSANQLMDDKYGAIPLPTKQDILSPTNTLVEVYEIKDGEGNQGERLQKLVIRVHHFHNTHDYTYVLARDGYIISAWTNMKTDIHRLRNRDVYFSNFKDNKVEAD